MAYNFLTVERDQVYLLPPSVCDWLPEDHLAWFVLDAIDQIDLEPFYADYRQDGWGAPARHPKMMVALMVYAYCSGLRSSRRIEQACHVDVGFRVVACNQTPDHTTIARFRQRHTEALSSVFVASLRLCAQAGMARVGVVALDGTKMGCPASLAANATSAHIDAEVAKMFAEAKAQDAAEDQAFGPDSRGDEPPGPLRGRKERKKRFLQAKADLDAQGATARAAHEAKLGDRAAKEAARGKSLGGRKPKARVPKAQPKANTSDPQSRMMKTPGGFVQGYNCQAVVNADQVVIAAEVTDCHNDQGQLHPMIKATKAALEDAAIDERPRRLLADAGYCSESNLSKLERNDPECYIATRNTYKNPDPRAGRRGLKAANATLVSEMDNKVSTEPGRQLYRARKHMVEPVFGQIKQARGARRFMRVGKAAAQSEWKLIMGTHNLLKLYRRSLTNPQAAPWTRTPLGGVTC
ncbi:MAG: transposase [Candidatus Dormibacteria bacterium]